MSDGYDRPRGRRGEKHEHDGQAHAPLATGRVADGGVQLCYLGMGGAKVLLKRLKDDGQLVRHGTRRGAFYTLEKLIHRLFAAAQIDLTVPDWFGTMVKPHEWFLVPLAVIDEVVGHIVDGSIINYVYDPATVQLHHIEPTA